MCSFTLDWHCRRNFKVVLIFLFLFLGNPLTDSILHYEPLNYRKDILYNDHNRVRRSLDPHKELHLDFYAHNRYVVIVTTRKMFSFKVKESKLK